MEIIRKLVQNLIVIVILAVFLEMFLPASDMRRYVKLILGLLVIIAVLQALGSLVQTEWKLELPELAINNKSNVAGLNEIMTTAKELNKDQHKRALDEYRQALSRQVSALASLYDEVAVVSVEVDVFDRSGSQKFGQVKEVRLMIKKVPPPGTQPVKITTESEKSKVEKLRETIANFYNISLTQVKVKYI